MAAQWHEEGKRLSKENFKGGRLERKERKRHSEACSWIHEERCGNITVATDSDANEYLFFSSI
ncbi:hypothetical protein E2C01_097221 [Portunus trituberculatus]|uniref:Uncharacterized protein n=1 Tax=Portunus trituberculatus TaxID=210409 RepID=A0A5B7JUL7_PORTR|nr:hypothetical protein [Portunus trituberculatus]